MSSVARAYLHQLEAGWAPVVVLESDAIGPLVVERTSMEITKWRRVLKDENGLLFAKEMPSGMPSESPTLPQDAKSGPG